MTSSEHWWLTEYADDIHNHLREKEQQRRVFHVQSPALHARTTLINLLSHICDQISICTPVLHLAVYLLDYFMDYFYIQNDQLKLFALSCLLLAAKSEEKDGIIPTTSELNRYVNDSYPLSQFLRAEITLLEFYQWDLVMPTAAHFLDYYIVFAISGSDLHEGRALPSLAHGKIFMSKYSQYFLNISLRDYEFLRYPPSLVASSCIAASRICLFLTPTWPQILYTVTSYNSDTLGSCIELMLRLLEDDEREMNSKKRKRLCCRN